MAIYRFEQDEILENTVRFKEVPYVQSHIAIGEIEVSKIALKKIKWRKGKRIDIKIALEDEANIVRLV